MNEKTSENFTRLKTTSMKCIKATTDSSFRMYTPWDERSQYEKNIQRFTGRLFRNRNDGAFVRVSAISDGNRLKQAKFLVQRFSQEVLNLLPEYWPIEQ